MSIIRQRKQKIRHFREPKVGDRYLDAVSRGDVEAIQDYISRRGNPHYADCKGQTALHIAVRHQQYYVLENLVPFFDNNQIDQRNMFGLSARKVAEELHDDKAVQIINNYLYVLQTSPYVNKSYSFKKPAKRGTNRNKKASIKNKAKNEDMGWNMMYLPKKGPSISRSPIVYHSANKKVVAIQNKKTRKTRVMPTIVQQNK